ncbi:MAG: DNA topoisomerase I [Actinobacteria bacterium]|nr:DNA topoisomerase I [Actinomycetota bacterium]
MKLIVSEKDKTAKRIAAILSNGKVKEEKTFKIPVYVFKDKNKEETKCIGLKGHILKVDYPEEYNNWQETNPVELIRAEIIKVPTQVSIIKALLKHTKGADKVIIATDFDREGELIGVDALNKIREGFPNIEAKRARFSALTKQEVEKSFSNLEDIHIDLAQAGEARQDIDLIWGATLTRFLSLASSRLGRQFLSVGRVQSPTLVLIVERERERQAFVSKPYWQIKAIFQYDSKTLEAHHKTEKFWDKKEAESVISRLGDKGTVVKTTRHKRLLSPPAPFNTTALLTTASTVLGLSAPNTMRIAENLYMNGFISYPRVDNTIYPDSLDLRELLGVLSQGEFGHLCQQILTQDKIVPTKGKKFATDHPPIHPTEAPKKEELAPSEWRVYELITRRFLATLAPEAEIESMRIDLDVNSEPFFTRGMRVLNEGWLYFYPYGRKKDVELPSVKDGDILKLLEHIMEEKETQPPSRYSQGRLIQLMEQLGLGTKATRHSIIQNLYERGYVHSDPIIPTDLGIAIAESLKKYAEAISSHEMTSELEKNMDAIAEGKTERTLIVDKSRDLLNGIMIDLVKKKEELAQEIRAGIRNDRIIGKCPNCGSELRVIRSRKTKKKFVGCAGYPNCNNAYPLPQRGDVIGLNENCEICGSPKIKVINKGSRPWIICIDPKCPSKNKEKDKAEKSAESV